jgi:putative membrane protein
MKFKSWIKTFLAGMAMGVATAIPGVSGGTIAVITGIYQKLIEAVNNLFKQFVKSILTLLPILLGVIIAIIPCVLIFDKAFEGFVFGLVSLFAGLVIGSFPGILKEVKNKTVKPSYIFTAVITGIIALGLGVLSIVLNGTIDLSNMTLNPEWWFYLVVVIFGMLASVALIVPGISGSMLMLVIGFYKPLIELLSNLLKFESENILSSLGLVACFGVGVIIGFLLVSKLMGYLLNKHHDITFYAIIGFIVGSTIALYVNVDIYNYYLVWGGATIEGVSPYLAWYIEVPIAIVLFIGGIIGAYFLVRYSNTHKENNK